AIEYQKTACNPRGRLDFQDRSNEFSVRAGLSRTTRSKTSHNDTAVRDLLRSQFGAYVGSQLIVSSLVWLAAHVFAHRRCTRRKVVDGHGQDEDFAGTGTT